MAAVGLLDVDSDLLVVACAGQDLGFVLVYDLVGLKQVELRHGFFYGNRCDRRGGIYEHPVFAKLKNGERLAGLVVRHGATATKDGERDQQKGREGNMLGHGKGLKRPDSKRKVQTVRC